jgi:GPI-GlcNAc transferase complex, PIG-H component
VFLERRAVKLTLLCCISCCLVLYDVDPCQFIDRDKLTSVFLHESIRGTQVCYDLAFSVQNQAKLSLSFVHVYPGVDALKRVFGVCMEL